ncbi:hypothetical protein I308_104567 [Cryptococcus tetragattii IND107]|uniref:Oxidoreductase n=1 Tax=Cryptococcus tetragattii IND107 TaxID=1296105 RepID=A0ABR3BQL0_9TREE|nr:hypothetical protein I308_01154 [Cryptococcus tetragattii IND107]
MPTSLELFIEMGRLALAGQTVMVTGGSGGIGGAISRLFKKAGCNVIVLGSSQEKLDSFVKSLPAQGGEAWGYSCDLRDRKQIDAVVSKITEERSPIDILINNAGFAIAANAPFWEQDLDNVASVMDVNLSGLMTITHTVLKYSMMQRKPHPTGTILNISSITGHQAPVREFFEASYHTSKAGVEGFTNVLRHELVGTNIRVLLNRPGTTKTEFHARRHGYDKDKTDATYFGSCPLAADDIAVSCLYQCLQPERISVVLLETLGTAQRSLYSVDQEYESRNGQSECREWSE